MTILEKLGIKVPWRAVLLNDESDATYIEGAEFCSDRSWSYGEFNKEMQEEIHTNAKLIASAPEMLEALIGMIIEYTPRIGYEPEYTKVVETATGKLWSEIKELIGEEE